MIEPGVIIFFCVQGCNLWLNEFNDMSIRGVVHIIYIFMLLMFVTNENDNELL